MLIEGWEVFTPNRAIISFVKKLRDSSDELVVLVLFSSVFILRSGN